MLLYYMLYIYIYIYIYIKKTLFEFLPQYVSSVSFFTFSSFANFIQRDRQLEPKHCDLYATYTIHQSPFTLNVMQLKESFSEAFFSKLASTHFKLARRLVSYSCSIQNLQWGNKSVCSMIVNSHWVHQTGEMFAVMRPKIFIYTHRI